MKLTSQDRANVLITLSHALLNLKNAGASADGVERVANAIGFEIEALSKQVGDEARAKPATPAA